MLVFKENTVSQSGFLKLWIQNLEIIKEIKKVILKIPYSKNNAKQIHQRSSAIKMCPNKNIPNL